MFKFARNLANDLSPHPLERSLIAVDHTADEISIHNGTKPSSLCLNSRSRGGNALILGLIFWYSPCCQPIFSTQSCRTAVGVGAMLLAAGLH